MAIGGGDLGQRHKLAMGQGAWGMVLPFTQHQRLTFIRRPVAVLGKNGLAADGAVAQRDHGVTALWLHGCLLG